MSWTPRETQTALWLDADNSDKVGTLDSNFVYLEDLSGNGRHLTQHTGALPAVDDSTFQNRRSIRFSGQVMKAPSLQGLAEGGIFIVLHQDNYPANSVSETGCWKLGGDSGSQNSHYGYTDGNIYEAAGSTVRQEIGGLTVDLADPHIYNVNTRSGKWEYRFNSVSQYENLTNTVGWSATTYIGGRDNDSSRFYGAIAEIVVTPTYPSDTVRNKIEGYLAHKWGLAAGLPSGHPYKTAKPPTEIPFAGSRVSGTVQVNGTPAARTVKAFSYAAVSHAIDAEPVTLSKSLGQSVSDPGTGSYEIALLEGFGREVFVIAFDDYGDDFAPELALNPGDRIHPTIPDGHVYECTGSGALPAEEPEWIIDTESSNLYGTASMIARQFYRPMVHGPIEPEITVPIWTPQTQQTVFWFDAQDAGTITTDISGNVELFEDKSGNGHNLQQTDSALRPRTAFVNGFNMLDARDGAYRMVAPNVTSPGGDMLISVMLEASPEITSGPYDSLFEIGGMLEFSFTRYTKSDRALVRFQADPNVVATSANGTYANSGVPAHVLTIHVIAGVGIYINVNGITIDAEEGAINPAEVVGQLMIFDGTNFSNVTPWQGLLGEIFFEPTALSAEEVQIREGYLAHKWGIADKLPANHPYKDEKPYFVASSDQHYNNVDLLLHMDGDPGHTVFLDSSPTPKALTSQGATIASSPAKFGESADINSGARIDCEGFPLNNTEFTIEAQVYFSSGSRLDSQQCLICQWSGNTGIENSYFLSFPANSASEPPNGINFDWRSGASTYVSLLDPAYTFAFDTWYHVAITRKNDVVRIFVNGEIVGEATASNTHNESAAPIWIGRLNHDSAFMRFNGFIDELRITSGVARYVAEFEPQSKAFPDVGPA